MAMRVRGGVKEGKPSHDEQKLLGKGTGVVNGSVDCVWLKKNVGQCCESLYS